MGQFWVEITCGGGSVLRGSQHLEGYADNGGKARFIQDAFGKSVKEVAPLLKDLADKGRLVATVTKEQVEQGDAYKKMMSEMRANSEDFGRSISVAVLPHLNDLLKTMREFQKGPGVVAGLLDVFNPSGFASKQEGLNAYNAQIAELDAKVRALRDDKRPLIAANAANEIRALEERRKKLVQYADGYTGPGGVHEPAGVVHKGEVVWSQADINKAGGVAVVESMRLGRRGYADGGIVGVTPAMSAGGRSRDRVIIQNFGAAQVETKEQKNAEGGVDTLVLLRQIESAMGANISNRSGPMYRSLASTFVPQGAR